MPKLAGLDLDASDVLQNDVLINLAVDLLGYAQCPTILELSAIKLFQLIKCNAQIVKCTQLKRWISPINFGRLRIVTHRRLHITRLTIKRSDLAQCDRLFARFAQRAKNIVRELIVGQCLCDIRFLSGEPTAGQQNLASQKRPIIDRSCERKCPFNPRSSVFLSAQSEERLPLQPQCLGQDIGELRCF
ncbi:MAG: hypothetical protein H2054_10005 [Sphingomonas sp.]|nr:hypothetical protein [Sphingomonas sp.]